MSTVQLGSAFKKASPDYGPLADAISSLRAAITADVRADMAEMSNGQVTAIAEAVAQAIAKMPPPNVSVAAPLVSVAAPDVKVTPTINVEGEDDAGEIFAMEQQTMVLRSIHSELVNLRVLLSQTVIRTVERDTNGQIKSVTETR